LTDPSGSAALRDAILGFDGRVDGARGCGVVAVWLSTTAYCLFALWNVNA
jgi:hypothetical protein